MGIVLFELITGSVPFTSEEIPKLYLSNNYSRKLQYGKNVIISQGEFVTLRFQTFVFFHISTYYSNIHYDNE